VRQVCDGEQYEWKEDRDKPESRQKIAEIHMLIRGHLVGDGARREPDFATKADEERE
jgi:hypothetical protein